MGCRMLLLLHVLHSPISRFKNNMGDCLEEQGERFTKMLNRLRNAIKAGIMKV